MDQNTPVSKIQLINDMLDIPPLIRFIIAAFMFIILVFLYLFDYKDYSRVTELVVLCIIFIILLVYVSFGRKKEFSIAQFQKLRTKDTFFVLLPFIIAILFSIIGISIIDILLSEDQDWIRNLILSMLLAGWFGIGLFLIINFKTSFVREYVILAFMTYFAHIIVYSIKHIFFEN